MRERFESQKENFVNPKKFSGPLPEDLDLVQLHVMEADPNAAHPRTWTYWVPVHELHDTPYVDSPFHSAWLQSLNKLGIKDEDMRTRTWPELEDKMALLQEWEYRTQLNRAVIPKGTPVTFLYGAAAPKKSTVGGPSRAGGAMQVAFEDHQAIAKYVVFDKQPPGSRWLSEGRMDAERMDVPQRERRSIGALLRRNDRLRKRQP